jgi:hypothetical protein
MRVKMYLRPRESNTQPPSKGKKMLGNVEAAKRRVYSVRVIPKSLIKSFCNGKGCSDETTLFNDTTQHTLRLQRLREELISRIGTYSPTVILYPEEVWCSWLKSL